MRLRNVTLDDAGLWERLRCDPVMMAELGGPLPRDGIAEKIRQDVEAVERDEAWIMVVETDEGEAAGSVVLWQHDDHGDRISEIGWMILPQFQGHGLARQAATRLLDRARADGRWGAVHAYPGVTNAPSNGLCRSLGFALVETVDGEWMGRRMRSHHWVIDLQEGAAHE